MGRHNNDGGRRASAQPHEPSPRQPVLLVATPANDTSPAACVDPFWACERTNVPQPRGIAANWFWPKALTGNTHPGASLPHGFVSVTAFSGAYPSGYGLNSPSSNGQPSAVLEGDYTKPDTDFSSVPYQYSTTGFAHFQPSGTGSIGNYMNYFRVMPLAGNATSFLAHGPPFGFRATLVGERAEPGKYAAVLGEFGVRAEVTATAGAALHRYTFPAPALAAAGGGTVAVDVTAAGLLSPGHTQPMQGVNITVSRATASSPWVVSGSLLTPPPAGKPAPGAAGLELFVRAVLGKGLTPVGVWPRNASVGGAGLGDRDGFRIELDAQQIAACGGSVGVAVAVDPTQPVAELAVGFSLRSEADAGASVNEAVAVGFDAVADAAWREWDSTLGRVAVLDDPSSTSALRERNLFYSVLFHALRKPTDATAFVPDSWLDTDKPGYAFDFGTMWDQYKTTLPMLVSIFPTMGATVLRGLVALARRFGEFPTGYTMDTSVSRFDGQANGLTHHTLADGLFRNYTDAVDWAAALALMESTFSNSTEGQAFVRDGVTAPEHFTHTLDLAGAAFATASVARSLGRNDDAARFDKLTRNSLGAFDASTCLLKNTSGYGYYEGTYFNYGFRPLTCMADRIALCAPNGSTAAAEARFTALMDGFFGYDREPAVQVPIVPSQGSWPKWASELNKFGYASHTFEGLCNEPDMETPYTYAYARRADRVQEVVAAVKAYSYAPGRGGLVGNDDSGGEAAWFVWASIGFFPVAGQPVYIIGSPSFARVAVTLTSASGDKQLVVERVGAGAYVQSGTLDGVDLGGRAWLWVSELHRAGDSTLTLTVGASPSPSWGSVPPPSF